MKRLWCTSPINLDLRYTHNSKHILEGNVSPSAKLGYLLLSWHWFGPRMRGIWIQQQAPCSHYSPYNFQSFLFPSIVYIMVLYFLCCFFAFDLIHFANGNSGFTCNKRKTQEKHQLYDTVAAMMSFSRVIWHPSWQLQWLNVRRMVRLTDWTIWLYFKQW